MLIPDQVRAVFNPAGGVRRIGVKWGVLALVLVAVVYPRPDLLVRNIAHWRDLDALIDPGAAGMDELEAGLRPRLAGVSGGPATLKVVQQYVVERIPYAWDWDTWGVVDYVPTVEQTLARGREDCDGRAVVAASLLRRLGYEAKLRSDLSHVWVWTPEGETMSPVKTASGRTVIAPAVEGKGSRIDWSAVFAWATLAKDMPTSMAYGVAVFPLWREGIVVGAACVVLAGRRARIRREAIGAGLLVAGLVVVRWTCADPWARDVAGAWGGLVLGVSGLAVLARSGRWTGAVPDGPVRCGLVRELTVIGELPGGWSGVEGVEGEVGIGVCGEAEGAGVLVR